MRIRQAFVSSAGAAALTVVAAASALVVNLGLLRQPSGDNVGTLTSEQVTTTTVAPVPDRTITIYLPDTTAVPVDPAPATTAPTTTVAEAVPIAYEDDDQYEQDGHETEGWEHEEYEGAQDDD